MTFANRVMHLFGPEEGVTMKELQKEAHHIARRKGFWDGVNPYKAEDAGLKVALIISECTEALEEIRRHGIRETNDLGDELADIVIRTMDLAEALQIDLEERVISKMEHNRTRPIKHGKLF